MVKLLICVVFLIAVFACIQVLKKIKINQRFQRSQLAKHLLKKPAVSCSIPRIEDEQLIEEIAIYEQQLFDDVACLFLESKMHEIGRDHAVVIQSDVLKKMPVQARSFIRDADLEEWSIFWGFYQQSLEYYVSKYGVFITHVDRLGNEHKYSQTFEISE